MSILLAKNKMGCRREVRGNRACTKHVLTTDEMRKANDGISCCIISCCIIAAQRARGTAGALPWPWYRRAAAAGPAPPATTQLIIQNNNAENARTFTMHILSLSLRGNG
jgi:hypothetical protein